VDLPRRSNLSVLLTDLQSSWSEVGVTGRTSGFLLERKYQMKRLIYKEIQCLLTSHRNMNT
jgi:hypothetical protein